MSTAFVAGCGHHTCYSTHAHTHQRGPSVWRVPVVVNAGPAHVAGASVLLDSGACPPSERRKIGKRRVVVIVGIPEHAESLASQALRMRHRHAPQRVLGSTRPVAYNGDPLARRRVHTQRNAQVRGFVHKTLNELLVDRLVMAPNLRGFDVQPQHAERVRRAVVTTASDVVPAQVADQAGHLAFGCVGCEILHNRLDDSVGFSNIRTNPAV